MTERRISLGVTLVGAAAFVALAAWLVPWDPVPGGPLQPVNPRSVLTAEEITRAEAYSGLTRILGWASLATSLLVACLLGFTRLGPAVLKRIPGWPRLRWWVQVGAAVVAVELIGRLVTLPFAVTIRQRALDYGLSNQPWLGFARDLAVGEGVDMLLTTFVLLVLVGSARAWRRAWPVVAGLLLAVLTVVGSFAYPVLIEPLFNRFTPLPDGPLRAEILRLADVEKVPVEDVLVADASRRTTTLNAYVSGIGGTRRVVVYDNLVKELPREQALSVVAHELAHARHQDVVVGTALGACGALVGIGMLGLLLPTRQRGSGMASPMVVPRVLALVAVAGLLSSPVQSGISRLVETRADVDALKATGDPVAFEEVQLELLRFSLADPSPPAWSQWWFGSHPTAMVRIALARRLS